LNNDEIKELKAINAAKGGLYAAENELMLMTVAALDRSDEVNRFLNTVNATNEDLTAKLKKVKAISENLQELGELFKKIAAVITGLTKLMAFLA
jgi:hypothetical protein